MQGWRFLWICHRRQHRTRHLRALSKFCQDKTVPNYDHISISNVKNYYLKIDDRGARHQIQILFHISYIPVCMHIPTLTLNLNPGHYEISNTTLPYHPHTNLIPPSSLIPTSRGHELFRKRWSDAMSNQRLFCQNEIMIFWLT